MLGVTFGFAVVGLIIGFSLLIARAQPTVVLSRTATRRTRTRRRGASSRTRMAGSGKSRLTGWRPKHERHRQGHHSARFFHDCRLLSLLRVDHEFRGSSCSGLILVADTSRSPNSSRHGRRCEVGNEEAGSKRVNPEVAQVFMLDEYAERMLAIQKTQTIRPEGIVEPLAPIHVTTTPRVVFPPRKKKWFSVSIVNDGQRTAG